MKMEAITQPIRLSIVDDHPVVAMGIKLILKYAKSINISITNQYINGAELINNLESLNSDVLLIDMCLPDMKGFELSRLVLQRFPEMKIGIYSNMLEREQILNAFRYGVLGYLPKSADSNEIIDFILTIWRGERYIRGAVANIIFESELVFAKKNEFRITKRESEVLHLILSGNRNKEIAERLSIAERTVEFHKQNLYVKLEVSNTVDLYKVATRLNLLSPKHSPL